MIIESAVNVYFLESLPKERQEYYLNLIYEYHRLINLSIIKELEIIELENVCLPSEIVI